MRFLGGGQMKGEINKDFYCSANYYRGGYCHDSQMFAEECRPPCKNFHRKHPTPEQFKEEYGEGWKGAVYTKCRVKFCKNDICLFYQEWTDFPETSLPSEVPDSCKKHLVKVCACTPWGIPPDDWRPE
jgi:hypothetical protein